MSHPTTDDMVALVRTPGDHRDAYLRGWSNADRPHGELAGTEDTVARAWAMGRDDNFSMIMDRGRRADYDETITA